MSSEHRLSIRLLGAFEIRLGEGVIVDGRWNRRKAAALVKLLSLQPRRSMHREQVLAALWPDKNPEAGANNLHKAAHYVRTALARAGVQDDLILLQRDNVALAPTAEVDVGAFVTLAERAMRARTDAALYELAIAAYAGPLLPADIYEDWTEPHRERLAEQARQLRLGAARLHEDAGHVDEAIACLIPVVDADPADEEASHGLIRLYAAAGDRWKARRHYKQHIEAMEALDLTPSATLDELLGAATKNRVERQWPMPDVRFVARRDGARIAYSVLGAGSRTPLVMLPLNPWSHMGMQWEIPAWRRWLQLLARNRPVVQFDICGLGLSGGSSTDMSFGGQLQDLAAVADAVPYARFDVFVCSNSAPQVLPFVAAHPARVRRMVFWAPWADGGWLAGALDDSGVTAMMRNQPELYYQSICAAAVGPDDPDLVERHMAYMASTPIESIIDSLETCRRTDVTSLLAGVWQPSLAISPAASPMVMYTDAVTAMVDALPRARQITMPDQHYHPIAGDLEALVATMDAFCDAQEGREFDDVPGLESLSAADAAG